MLPAPVPLPVATAAVAILFALQAFLSVKRGGGSKWKWTMRLVAPVGFVALVTADLAAYNSTSALAAGCYAGLTLVCTIVAFVLGSRHLQYIMAATGILVALFGFAAFLRFLYLLASV